jgi:peptidoglycan/LPS O-acetylase OafA/YrhL
MHLPFLDGIRALMALWVAFGHGFQDLVHVANSHNGNSSFCPQQFFVQAFYAHFAVDVFIVLSGFCLMLPVARHGDYSLSGGWRGFYFRRARRILPPYYAALALALCLSGVRWWITNPGWESKVIEHVDFPADNILAHLFLIQNMWDPWARAVDGPTWSVATEFQIYLLFPILFLPLWRKMKPIVVVTITSIIGLSFLALTWNFPKSGWTSCSWFLGLFAMGMFAADWYVRDSNKTFGPKMKGVALILLSIVLAALIFLKWSGELMFKLDFLVGAASALLIAYFASSKQREGRSTGLSVLEWKPLVTLGTFSYSFYLIHAPILYVPVTFLLRAHADAAVGAITLLLTIVAIIFTARLFYKYIELPSMAKR